MANSQIYDAVRTVPPSALKPIEAGRLKGKSDINPMWRIKTLTEQFGPCGIGWKYEIVEKRLEKGGGDEVAAFVDINLYYKYNGAWSEAIPGTGGSSFVAQEYKGLYTSDECFKMALTDAIGVACKALGVGADVYWDKDATKYTREEPAAQQPPASTPAQDFSLISLPQQKRMFALSGGKDEIVRRALKEHGYEKSGEVKKAVYEAVCAKIQELAATPREPGEDAEETVPVPF